MRVCIVTNPTENDLRKRLGKLSTFDFGYPIRPVSGTLIEAPIEGDTENAKELKIQDRFGLTINAVGIKSIRFNEEIGKEKTISSVPKPKHRDRYTHGKL